MNAMARVAVGGHGAAGNRGVKLWWPAALLHPDRVWRLPGALLLRELPAGSADADPAERSWLPRRCPLSDAGIVAGHLLALLLIAELLRHVRPERLPDRVRPARPSLAEPELAPDHPGRGPGFLAGVGRQPGHRNDRPALREDRQGQLLGWLGAPAGLLVGLRPFEHHDSARWLSGWLRAVRRLLLFILLIVLGCPYEPQRFQ